MTENTRAEVAEEEAELKLLNLKDDRGQAAGGGRDYQNLVMESRKEQLKLTLSNVRRLEATFDAAVESIAAKVEALPADRQGFAWHRAQVRLLSEIRQAADALKRDYQLLLDVGMIDLAQNAAERERQTAALIGAPSDASLAADLARTVTLSNSLDVTVRFGRLALGAVERAATRYYGDGLKLSDRLYKLDRKTRKVIENTIVQGLTEQISAAHLAKRLRSTLAAAGSENPRYDAMRIARTEIRTAHVEAHVLSTQKPGGGFKDYIQGIRWNLSASHPKADICDLWAGWDSGMGEGVYTADDLPPGHPHDLCFTSTVLVAFPDSGVGSKPAPAGDVPAGQRRLWEAQRAA